LLILLSLLASTYRHWYFSVSLSEVDRQLLQRCLDRAPRAWQDFVDRFLGLVVHVANHTAESRGLKLDGSTRDDLVAEVFLTLVTNDFAVLRRFRRNCSLATYLTVISRRVIVRRLRSQQKPTAAMAEDQRNHEPLARIENQEEVQKLLLRLDPKEANVVRMYHLEGKSYEEIGRAVGIATNSVGPVLSRARDKMRN
jgi:RNA polymerase sigma-70 factor, ECF subfamily